MKPTAERGSRDLDRRGEPPGTLVDVVLIGVAVTTVVALAFLALVKWAEDGTDEPFMPTLARFLLAAPHPARLSAGATSAMLAS